MAPRLMLLHGTMEARIGDARNTYDPSRLTSWVPMGLGEQVQSLEESVGIGTGMVRIHVVLGLDGSRLVRTRDVVQCPAPSVTRYNETIRAYCAHTVADVVFSVMIQQLYTYDDTLLGSAYIPVQELLSSPNRELQGWFDVLDASRRKIPGDPQLWLSVKFTDVAADTAVWGGGVDGAGCLGVPHTFFPQRTGCKVTLYQDAHTVDSLRIPLDGGGNFQAERCWEGVFYAISNAKHLVYIAGWSVNTKITLIRDGTRTVETLGHLLKRKADEEGVRVLLLVWDDPTSLQVLRDLGFTMSLMETHDEDTAADFRNSGVHCVLVQRELSVVYHGGGPEQEMPMWFYTHHQKTIIVDQYMRVGGRQIVSYVGGIDLCDGRYDTPGHSLFRTLREGQAHHDDFHQPSLAGATVDRGGPREPWHDIHSKLEGPVAWDVLSNFEQRWKKQAGMDKADLLVDVDALVRSGLIMPSSTLAIQPDYHEAWNVQVFRSIDSTSTLGFPDAETREDRLMIGLVCGKNQIIERSIHDAYIHAIRRAKNFIYIENQYFIGSSFQWKDGSISPRDPGAQNLIPRELSLKIVSKIEAGERFAVYIVLPMWPEGLPESGTMQEMLHWQRKTVEMMYDDIAVALINKNKTDANPRDYLTFFCLGNREFKSNCQCKPMEVKCNCEYEPPSHPFFWTHYARAQKARRFMIYVHAKMMIVDDEYIIVGSANINQRSMDGGRDTEIAMGAYQPHHLNTSNQVARGRVHGFRMSLWHEHLNSIENQFLDPASLACVQRVNKLADDNWSRYARDMLDGDLPGHLLAYPITVARSGAVKDLVDNFPDTEAQVCGKKSGNLVSMLTA